VKVGILVTIEEWCLIQCTINKTY